MSSDDKVKSIAIRNAVLYLAHMAMLAAVQCIDALEILQNWSVAHTSSLANQTNSRRFHIIFSLSEAAYKTEMDRSIFWVSIVCACATMNEFDSMNDNDLLTPSVANWFKWKQGKKLKTKSEKNMCWKVMNGHWIIGWLCAIAVCSSKEIGSRVWNTHRWLLDFRKNITVTFDTCKINWNTAGTTTTKKTQTSIITSINSCGGCSKSQLTNCDCTIHSSNSNVNYELILQYVESSAKKNCSLHGENSIRSEISRYLWLWP